MNVMEAIATRRSIRKYCDRPIEEEKLNLVLEAARLSPSSANSQNWQFIVVRDKEKIQKLMEAADGQPSVGEAPCAIVACATKSRVMDCGQPTDTVDFISRCRICSSRPMSSVSARAGSAIFTPIRLKRRSISPRT